MRVALNDRAGLYGYVTVNNQIHTHTVSLIPPWEEPCEWHRVARMTGADCAIRCKLTTAHTHTVSI